MGKNLWLALNKGISRLEYGSPFFFYDEKAALPGIVMAVSRHLDSLYVGTGKGLFVFPPGSKTFHPVAGINSDCRSLLSTGPYLLAATLDGVFQVDYKKNSRQRILKGKVLTLLPSQLFPGRIWCGMDSGLAALTRKKNRIVVLRFPNAGQGIESIFEDKKGYLLLVTSTGNVLKVDTVNNGREPVVIPYDHSAGIDKGVIYCAAWAAGHAIFASEKGIFRFDEKKETLIPDRTLGDIFAGGSDSKPVFRMTEDKNGDTWFNSESMNYRAIPGDGGSFKTYHKPFLRLPAAQTNTICR